MGVLGGVQPEGDGFIRFDGGSLLSAGRAAFRPVMRNASRRSLAGFTRPPIFGVMPLDVRVDLLLKRGLGFYHDAAVSGGQSQETYPDMKFYLRISAAP